MQFTHRTLQDSAAVREELRQLRAARAVDVRQGNLEVIFSTVRFTAVAGTIATQARIAFLDQLGTGANSGIVQTRADSNFFGGQVPAGQIHVLGGMGISLYSEQGQITALDITKFARNVSIRVNLRNNPVFAGSLANWPSIEGARGEGNGNTTYGIRSWAPAVVLEPLQNYSVDVIVERAMAAMAVPAGNYDVQIWHPSTRIYDPNVLQRG